MALDFESLFSWFDRYGRLLYAGDIVLDAMVARNINKIYSFHSKE